MRKNISAKKITAWILAGAVMAEPALALAAPMAADRKAPAEHRPLVQTTANGTTLINITAPTEGGVSRNMYTDFNVTNKGAVLNNSYKMTETQLAGWVQGNQQLIKGPAEIIVNEVTGGNHSELKGFLEVAGNRASVVLANPNGIAVNGGGFINTSRAVLATGKAMYDGAGNLTGFNVTDGKLSVSGAGMDARQTDSVDLLARAVEINAGLWAKDAHIITGANKISYPSLKAEVLQGNGDKPQVALDVAALGGMYAGRITLLGTEKGVGVNTQGTLNATEGNIALTNNGDIILAGKIAAKDGLSVNAAGNIKSTAAAGAKNNVTLKGEDISNSGTLYGKNLLAEGKEMTNEGAFYGDKSVLLTAGGNVVNSGNLLTGGDLKITGQKLVNSGTVQSEGAAKLFFRDAVINTENIYGKTLNIEGAALRSDGNIVAEGDVKAAITGTSAVAGKLIGNNLVLTGAELKVAKAAQLGAVAKAELLFTGDVKNEGKILAGTLQAKGKNLLTSDELHGSKKVLLDFTGDVTNSGNVLSGGDLQAFNGKKLVNSGEIRGAGKTELLFGGSVTNTKNIYGRTLNIKGAALRSNGNIIASGDLTAGFTGKIELIGKMAGDNLQLKGTELQVGAQTLAGANKTTTLAFDGAVINKGEIVGDALTLTGTTFTNSGSTQGAAKGVLKFSEDIVNTGKIFGGDMEIGGSGLINRGTLNGAGKVTLKMRGDIATENSLNARELTAAGRKLTNTGKFILKKRQYSPCRVMLTIKA